MHMPGGSDDFPTHRFVAASAHAGNASSATAPFTGWVARSQTAWMVQNRNGRNRLARSCAVTANANNAAKITDPARAIGA